MEKYSFTPKLKLDQGQNKHKSMKSTCQNQLSFLIDFQRSFPALVSSPLLPLFASTFPT